MRLAIVLGVLLLAAEAGAAPMTGIVDLAAAGEHACAVLATGEVACWGAVEYRTVDPSPALVPGVGDAIGVSVGPTGRCAVTRGGEVWCWGSAGHAGRNLPANVHDDVPPAPVVGIRDATQVSAGHVAACARHRSGAVSCWGDNDDGQLGVATTLDRSPVPVAVPGIKTAVEVALSTFWTTACARLASREVMCWGKKTAPHVVPGIADAEGISVGKEACAVRKGGRVTCWMVGGGDAPVDKLAGGAIHLADNGSLACAAQADGTARCWGSGYLGDGARIRHDSSAGVVRGIANAKQIAMGDLFACVRRADGTAACWGENDRGQLGRASRENVGAPVAVRGVARATAVAVGPNAACAVTAAGVSCWGAGRAATTIAGTADAIQVSVSEETACATMRSGAVTCWPVDGGGLAMAPRSTSGDAIHVGVRDGTYDGGACTVHRDGRLTCTGRIPTPKISDAAQVVLCGRSCARSRTNEARCWDADGSVVTIATDVRQLASTGGALCVLGARGDVRCGGGTRFMWGNRANSATADLAPLTDPAIEQVAVGFAHACVRRRNGSVACWGYNHRGQLGAGAIGAAVAGPVTVALAPAVDVAAHRNSTCAVLRDGTVACWGENSEGQVGDGTTGTAYAPGAPVEQAR